MPTVKRHQLRNDLDAAARAERCAYGPTCQFPDATPRDRFDPVHRPADAHSLPLTADFGSHYYLIVPRNFSFEGSYGVDRGGGERPVGATTCAARMIAGCP
jgi:hypothetical protein